jgi:hypothetical protein
MSQETVWVKNEVIRRWFWAFENDGAEVDVRFYGHADRAAVLEAAGLSE